jgi:hypothetical protein
MIMIKLHVDPSFFRGAIELLHLVKLDELIKIPTAHIIAPAISILSVDRRGFVSMLLPHI